VYDIQPLAGPSNEDSQCFGMNGNNGVAGVFFAPTSLVGARWNGGSPPSFTMPANSESILYAVNDAGNAVGLKGFNNTPTERAILVTGSTVHDLAVLVGEGSLATGINNAGRVCGSGGNSPKAFVYDSASNTVIAHIDPVAGGAKAYAIAINELGHVVGDCDNNHGFFYDGSIVKDLGLAGFIEDVNEADKICGSVGKAWPQAFSPGTWDGTAASPTFTEIPVPAGFLGGHASGINNNGDIVGTCWTPQTYDGNQSAYIHTAGVSTDLNTLISASGWHLEFAEGINDKGQIAGIGQLNGNSTAFLLTPQDSWPFGHITLPDLVAILILGGVIYGGAGVVITPGGPHPVDPRRLWEALAADKRDALVGLALDQLAQRIENREAREAIRKATLAAVRGSVDRLFETAHLPASAPAQPMMAKRRTALSSGKLATSLARFGHVRGKIRGPQA
jgi:probable HAF family extracellular repeat protein